MAQSEPVSGPHREGEEVPAFDSVRRNLRRHDMNRSLEESAVAGGLAGVALAGALFAAGSVLRKALSRRTGR